MANVREDDLPVGTTLVAGDFFRKVDDLAGTPQSEVISIENVKAWINSFIASQFVLANQGSGIASTTSGATAPSQAEMTTNKQNVNGWIFPAGSQKYIEVSHPFPSDYNGGTVTAKFYWTANSTSTNSVVWGIQGRSYADNEAIDQAWGTAQEVTDANGSSVYTTRISSATSAITLSGTPAASELAQWRIYRLGSGSDNLAVSAILLAVVITYTRA